jgi:hypothetical protein
VRNLWRALNSDDLNKMGAAVDEEATQDNENQSYGDERPPIVFEEWVAPLAIVADRRATSVFKTWVCHYPRPALSHRHRVMQARYLDGRSLWSPLKAYPTGSGAPSARSRRTTPRDIALHSGRWLQKYHNE